MLSIALLSKSLNFATKTKTLATVLLITGTLIAFSLAPMSTVFAVQDQNNQTTQINQIQFEPSVDLQDAKGYLEIHQFNNLKYASVTTVLETNNHIVPLTVDYDLKDINKTTESYNSQKIVIVEGIRKSKADKIKSQTPEAIEAKKAEKQKQKNDLIRSL